LKDVRLEIMGLTQYVPGYFLKTHKNVFNCHLWPFKFNWCRN